MNEVELIYCRKCREFSEWLHGAIQKECKCYKPTKIDQNYMRKVVKEIAMELAKKGKQNGR